MTGSASGAVPGWLFGTEAWLDILYPHVVGIDVHKKQVTVTARIPDPRRQVARKEKTRTFRTFYADLLAMASWLVELGVTRVAMESTGPYWWPVYVALREAGGPDLTIDVVNAAHVKAVPGRKMSRTPSG